MPVLPPEAADVAARNHGLLDRGELLVLPGVTRPLVDNLVRHGALLVEHRGGYRVPGAPVTPQQALLCATRRARGHAADGSTLGLHGAEGFPLEPPFAVAIPRARRLRGTNLTVVRVDLDDEDIEEQNGVPTMTAARACVSLAGQVRLPRLRAAVHDLRRRGVLDVRVMRRRAEALGSDRGAVQMRAYLTAGALLPESEPEAGLAHIWQLGDPRPEAQVWVQHRGRCYRLDLCFLASRLAPEYDGEAAHGGTTERLADADRTLALAELQIQRLAITAPLLRAPAELRERLLRLHAERIAGGISPLTPSAPPRWWDGV